MVEPADGVVGVEAVESADGLADGEEVEIQVQAADVLRDKEVAEPSDGVRGTAWHGV